MSSLLAAQRVALKGRLGTAAVGSTADEKQQQDEAAGDLKRRKLQITDSVVSVQDARMGFNICIVGY